MGLHQPTLFIEQLKTDPAGQLVDVDCGRGIKHEGLANETITATFRAPRVFSKLNSIEFR